MDNRKVIGIVGGVGPDASLYTMQKVLDNTKTSYDQDHLPVILISKPELIEDRSKFLLSNQGVNPAYSILSIISQLEQAGADIIGLPCNTAHADRIMSVIVEGLRQQKSKVLFLNIIDEVIQFIHENLPKAHKIGILTTSGLYYDGEYVRRLEKSGYEAVVLSEESQNNLLHDAIYNPVYGIKALGNQVSEKVRHNIERCIEELRALGTQAIILGCTELPLVVKESQINGIPLLDSANILARALIRESDRNKLK